MIYLNNAGTTWPKPAPVLDAVAQFHAATPDSWGPLFAKAHAEICAWLGIAAPERFLLTPGCTSALALGISELPWEAGDVLLTSTHEHHAVARWGALLAELYGVVHETVPMDASGCFALEVAEGVLRKGRVRLVACSMASNVTGALLPAKDVVALSHQYGALCLLDGAQVTGGMPIDLSQLQADLFAFAGHKGPMAPQGIGGLYIGETVAMRSPAAVCSLPGPGEAKPTCTGMPSYCDLGSVNMAALTGLMASVRWLQTQGPQKVRQKIIGLTQRLLDGLAAIEGVEVFGPAAAAARNAAVSLRLSGLSVGALGQALKEEFGIVGSAGFHCAPMAHEAIGTQEEGTFRLSAGWFTKDAELDAALDAVATLASRHCPKGR